MPEAYCPGELSTGTGHMVAAATPARQARMTCRSRGGTMAVVTVWSEESPLAPHGDWTVDDLARLPDDGRQYELFDGVLVVSPASFPLHQRVVGALMLATYALRDGEYVETHTVNGDIAQVAEPFAVSVCPAKLTRPGAGGS